MKPDFQIITEGDSSEIHNQWPRFLDCFPVDPETGMVAICQGACSAPSGKRWRKVADFKWITEKMARRIWAE